MHCLIREAGVNNEKDLSSILEMNSGGETALIRQKTFTEDELCLN